MDHHMDSVENPNLEIIKIQDLVLMMLKLVLVKLEEPSVGLEHLQGNHNS